MDHHDLMISILGSLKESELNELKQVEVEEECIFTQEADIEDDELLVQAEQEYRLQVRGDYLVECVEGKIIGGLKCDTSCQFQIKRYGLQGIGTLPKPFAFILYLPDDNSSDDQIAIKLGIEIHHYQTLENFVACLQKKDIIQINCYSCYKTLQRISRTMSSCVYCVERLRDHQVLAIKGVYRPSDDEEEETTPQRERQILTYKSVIKEYSMMRKLAHNSICRVEGLFQADNSIFLVMECLKMNLLQFVQKVGFKSANDFKHLVFKIFQAVHYIHHHNVMHRDLKLENIMMRELEPNVFEPVLIDFGLAEYEGMMPYTFVRCGTPGYAAPEIINSNKQQPEYTKQCDVFSLGCVLHCLLLGRILFEGPIIEQVIEKNRMCQIDHTLPLYSSLQPNAKDLLFGMLKKDPSQRITMEAALTHCFFTQQSEQTILPKYLPIKLHAPSS